MTDRAQSETVGVIMLTAVIVVLAGGFGVVYLGTVDGGASDGPLLDVRITATGDTVTLEHAGGESIPSEDLEVIVRGDGTSQRHALADWATDADDSFDPSDRVSGDRGVEANQFEVLLVHVPSNEVLERAYLDA